ncbi:hypothetical protein BLNAU_3896 [Blattamonas nauphoetae]|uniref:Uncharacterized protein n=1 Tax=Blattamonas nauphoetae TaxID=2049346 RepID=A0ABQ9YBI4_9EUKA|nr:hypothetical protein BLNAU_3896 [Blattamonas nauphoetae]
MPHSTRLRRNLSPPTRSNPSPRLSQHTHPHASIDSFLSRILEDGMNVTETVPFAQRLMKSALDAASSFIVSRRSLSTADSADVLLFHIIFEPEDPPDPIQRAREMSMSDGFRNSLARLLVLSVMSANARTAMTGRELVLNWTKVWDRESLSSLLDLKGFGNQSEMDETNENRRTLGQLVVDELLTPTRKSLVASSRKESTLMKMIFELDGNSNMPRLTEYIKEVCEEVRQEAAGIVDIEASSTVPSYLALDLFRSCHSNQLHLFTRRSPRSSQPTHRQPT